MSRKPIIVFILFRINAVIYFVNDFFHFIMKQQHTVSYWHKGNSTPNVVHYKQLTFSFALAVPDRDKATRGGTAPSCRTTAQNLGL